TNGGRETRRQPTRTELCAARSRCPNSAKPGGEAGGIEWTAVHQTERCNRLPLQRLSSEVQRHQPLAETRSSEFESLPPSHSTRLHLASGKPKARSWRASVRENVSP